jgi:hypothetical protein
MDGFGSHTFQWDNARGEIFWVKYHFKTDQGIKCLTAEGAARVASETPDYHQRNPLRAIDRGEYPSWTLKMQIMSAAEATKYRFNPFDVTKVWPHYDYPLITIAIGPNQHIAGRGRGSMRRAICLLRYFPCMKLMRNSIWSFSGEKHVRAERFQPKGDYRIPCEPGQGKRPDGRNAAAPANHDRQ